ncbi:MAG: HU family DNA-binding protein [Caldithrix sp.]|nr:MAG: HU family DNA-binding protein [Caldithrix sp.]
MTKDELIINVMKTCNGNGLSKRLTTDILNNAFTVMGKALKKDKRFSYPGFGTFTVRKRKARLGRNPQTGEIIKISASKTVGFKPSPKLKESL